jgi:prevent-host-death family protein
MIKITTMDLRRNLGQILDTVAEKNEQVIISRANRPLAVILPIAEFELTFRTVLCLCWVIFRSPQKNGFIA